MSISKKQGDIGRPPNVVLSWDEWSRLDAVSMAALVRQGDVSAAELASQAAEAVALMNPKLNAVLEVFEDVVESPLKDGMNPDGALAGVPMLVKDVGSGLKGRLQERGAKFLEGMRRENDDTLVENWRSAGLNLIGRTSLPTCGFAAVSDSLIHGITRNPWNLDRTPSGSSGGSAAAVAAGIVPIASASDGAGSTRSPAGWNGLIGLKPSRGLLPLAAGANEFSRHLGVEGVLTKTVRDSALAYDYMCRHKPGDSFMPVVLPKQPFTLSMEHDPGRLRIALSLGEWGCSTPRDADVVRCVRRTAESLEALGHAVDEVADSEICDWQALWRGALVNWLGGTRFWPELAADAVHTISEETCEAVFRYLIDTAQAYGLSDYRQMQLDNDSITRCFGRFFEQYDLLLTPVEAVVAHRCGPESRQSPLCPVSSHQEAKDFIQKMIEDGRYMFPANDAGYPAISVPAGMDRNGVPLGAQLSAAWTREDLLFQVARQLEVAYPEHFNQIPPHHVSTRTSSEEPE